jgi:hypothetical protein
MLWRTELLASEMSSPAKMVAFVLSTHMDRNGGSCFPSLTTIARESGYARSTVCQALAELDRANLLERVRGGRGKPTRYHATSPLTGLPVVRQADSTSPTGGPEDVQEDVHKFSTRTDVRAKKKKSGRAGARRSKNTKTVNTAGAHLKPDGSVDFDYLNEGTA